ncbi:hydroxyethylthiazole kinase [Propylenella binzhouense]|uniref:Hydroxyethylthiazole kinase n=1 Tax=Propylenella binzhouense TaxID=2555902 RepID=A0A964WTC8_9HYPH|nr:hydroxyethylthiazole kinase [Propylenella binzhouense]MYZ47902.1 hydroxyethylthiazole kinase [Propylenella binzhouense]
MIDDIWNSLREVRAKAPLVLNITNYVVMNSTANALLAVGASPIMAHSTEEVEDLVAVTGALVVNIGTLSPPWVAAMRLAARKAAAVGTPWVLDPVGVGATAYRNGAAAGLAAFHPAAVRGNASEILALAGASGAATKGVDSTVRTEASIEAAAKLTDATGSVVAVTGRTDYVIFGDLRRAIHNGHPMMARVTGLGCTATALIGAFLAAVRDPFEACFHALVVIGIAGEVAAERAAGPGSLQMHLLDALYAFDRETLARRIRID